MAIAEVEIRAAKGIEREGHQITQKTTREIQTDVAQMAEPQVAAFVPKLLYR